MHKNPLSSYEDENPEQYNEYDDANYNTDVFLNDNDNENEDDPTFSKSKNPTCPHYRQLTSSSTASRAHRAFVPCCTSGNHTGDRTALGVHDIEDLVSFGKHTNLRRNVPLYRGPKGSSYGMSLEMDDDKRLRVTSVRPNGPAASHVRSGDIILAVNGSDTSNMCFERIVDKIKGSKDPLILDIHDGSTNNTSACPYYLSQALAKEAEVVFAPYNYLLDPGIRKALGIDLNNAIVVLDEGHNVESNLRECGSGKYAEGELCDLMVILSYWAATESSDHANDTDMYDNDGNQLSIGDAAHHLMVFLETLINFGRNRREENFENHPGAAGANAAVANYKRFKTPDDHEFEISQSYWGPTGRGERGKPVGCAPLFQELGLTQKDMKHIFQVAEAFLNKVRSTLKPQDYRNNLIDRLEELIDRFVMASENAQHYYIALVAQANGNLAFASGEEDDTVHPRSLRFGKSYQKAPRALPLMPPRTKENPQRLLNPCSRCPTKHEQEKIRHGLACDGSTPSWEFVYVLDLLSPGIYMTKLAAACHSVILASGSLAPIPSLMGELNLLPPVPEVKVIEGKMERKKNTITPVEKIETTLNEKESSKLAPSTDVDAKSLLVLQEKLTRRLQIHPKPLEAGHVINMEKQLLAVSVGHFHDGSEIKVTYANYRNPEFLLKLGTAVASIIETIPSGGILVFLPSYSLLNKCARVWKESVVGDVWDRLVLSKGKVIIEETGSSENFENMKADYNETIQSGGSCILLAVYRGKMSEGVSFNDDYARGVICIGLPLPNAKDRGVLAKKDYNDEQRKLCGRTDLISGYDWYRQQAYRAIAQALGRCIRHRLDYGCIFLLDSRHCDDNVLVQRDAGGICRNHQDLPRWIRRHVKNLTEDHESSMGMSGSLQQEVTTFQFFVIALCSKMS